MVTFAQARELVAAEWPDYKIAPYGYEGTDSWFLILLPETAGGRVPAVSKETGAIRWINENAKEYTQQHPVGDGAPTLVAAADVHTGAMVALVPTDADIERLLVDGGEPAEYLHVTMHYLGDATTIDEPTRTAILDAVSAAAADMTPIEASGFALSLFNPTNDERDTCIVLSLSGADLSLSHDAVSLAVTPLNDQEQHQPWHPHLTLVYTDDAEQLAELVDRTGPVTFDRLRVAFGAEITDIPLEAAMTQPALLPADTAPVTGTGGQYGVMVAPPGVEHFHTVVMEGVSTGLRTFAENSLTWREPPFAFHWEYSSAAHGGQMMVAQVGLVTRVERMGSEIHFWGPLDLADPIAVEYARKLVDGFTRWSSIGIDESLKDADVEMVFPEPEEEPAPPGEEDGDIEEMFFFPEPDQIIFHKARIAEITAVSVPALADATVEPTQALIDTLGGTLTAGAVGTHDTATSEGAWDGPANEKRLPSPMPEATARNAYAWIDDAAVVDGGLPKTGAKFIHHEVSSSGTPGAANTTACSTGIGVLNGGRGGTTIPDADVQGTYDHLAAHLRDAGLEPPPLQAKGATITAAGYTITIPDLPPADWFEQPSEEPAIGALTITDEGRVFGWLAPAGVSHRAFRGQRAVFAPRGQDFSEFMNKTAFAEGADGQAVRIAAGNITMSCEHASPVDPRRVDPGWAGQHYENSCSIFARVRVGESADGGTWVAGALLPDVDWAQVSRALGCALSGDWQGGKLKAALMVPVEGFPRAQVASARTRVTDGVLVASAIPVRFRRRAAAPEVNLRPVLEAIARHARRDSMSRLAELRRRHPERTTS